MWLHLALLPGVLAGWTQIGAASPDWTALVERGVERRLAGDDAQALILFREAERMARTPRLLAQTALAEQALGHWREAELHLREALASENDGWIVKQRDALDGALSTITRHLGTLELRGGDGGDVFVDGHPEGKLPRDRPLRLEIGKHRVEVRKAGTFPFVRDVEITSETAARETVTLTPGGAWLGDAAPRDAARRDAAPTAPISTHRVLGWSLVGAGLATSTVAVASLVASNRSAHDYNADPRCTGRPGQPETCGSQASSARDWRMVSIASFATSGALSVAGVAVLLWKSSSTPVRVQLAPGFRSAEVGLSGTF